MSALARRMIQVPTSTSGTNAEKPFDPFSRFGPLKKVPIRTPKKKDQLTRLRELREMLKSGNLTPEQIHSMMVFHPNLNMFEAVERAEKEGSLLVPNIVHDRILNQTNVIYQSSTGTLAIYEYPNQPFRESVAFISCKDPRFSISFQVPKDFQGRRNYAIVIEYPDFTFVRTGEYTYKVELTEGAVVHLVENFPVRNGWYKQNEFGLPYGNTETKSRKARYLQRSSSSYIGSVVRFVAYHHETREVYADFGHYGALGVALIS